MEKIQIKSDRTTIYKNDLKFSDNLDIENSDFETDDIKNMYNDFNKKPKIELRIKDCELENYNYLDLSDLSLTDNLLNKLFKLEKIKNILSKIEFLDLSNNNLTTLPQLIVNNKYNNILYLNIARNSITTDIINDNLLELSCEFNKIKKIESKSLIKLSSSNNELFIINTPKIEILVINNNFIDSLSSFENLEYLECINNKISKISNMNKLTELFISNNKLVEIDKLQNLNILNCTDNPIKKIKFFENISTIMCSTSLLSSRYKIKSINKVNNKYYLINIV
jgi:Leucine-rich repeat (LRR) protein